MQAASVCQPFSCGKRRYRDEMTQGDAPILRTDATEASSSPMHLRKRPGTAADAAFKQLLKASQPIVIDS